MYHGKIRCISINYLILPIQSLYAELLSSENTASFFLYLELALGNANFNLKMYLECFLYLVMGMPTQLNYIC